MAETIYETTIADYESVIGALPANSAANPYTVKITDIENLAAGNLNIKLRDVHRYVSIIWNNGAIWNENDATKLFSGANYLLSIDTSPFINVTNAYEMFSHSGITTIDTTSFSNVIYAAWMFNKCTELTSINISNFNNVIFCEAIFSNCINLTDIEISSFNNLLNTLIVNELPISVLNVNVTKDINSSNELNLFKESTPLKIRNLSWNFVLSTTIDNYENKLSFFDMNNYNNPYTIKIIDIENLTKTNLKNAISNAGKYVNIIWKKDAIWAGLESNDMFSFCSKLISIDTSPFINVNDISRMFYECNSLKLLDASGFINISKADNIFYNNENLSTVYITLETSQIFITNVSNNTNAKIRYLTIETTIENYDTTLAKYPENTINNPYTVKILDINNLHYIENTYDTLLRRKMISTNRFVNIIWAKGSIFDHAGIEYFFKDCTHLVSIDLLPFSMYKRSYFEFVTQVFSGCTSLQNINISFGNRTYSGAFENCTSLLDVKFSYVTPTSLYKTFSGCTNLTSIDLNEIDGLSVKNLEYTFSGCISLTSIDKISFKRLTVALSAFSGCTRLTSIDISVFDKVTNAQNMFANCTGLTDVVVSDMSKDINSVVAAELPSNVTDVYFPNDHKSFGPDYEVYLEPYSTLQNKTLHYVLSDVYPKSTTLANYARNVSSLDVNNSSTPYDIKITDFKDHVATDFSTAIIGGDRFVNLTFDDDTYEFDDATCMFEDCTKIVSLDITPFIDIAIGDFMFHNIPIPTLDETLFTKLTSANNMFDGTGKVNFNFTNAKDLEEVTVPSSAKKFLVNDTALERIDLSEASNLEYLDVSNTNITSLNLIHCSSLPYCEWDTINDEKVLVKGWLAKNCTSLLTVKATETQVQDANLNLKNDTNALEGCTALQEVEVACNSRPSYSGNEVHYGKVKFENEVIFNNGFSLGEQALKDIFNIFVPVNKAKYIQLGGDPYPWEFYPFTKKTDWKNISNQYANEYFRVVGGEKPMGYFLTEDTEIVAGKTYYTRSGTDPNYTYTAVASPVVANIGTYYELSGNLTASTINNGDSDYLHEVQQEGLPNIEGNLYAMATDVSNSSNGCFTMQLVRDARDEGGSGNFKYYNIQLKASTSNPIYGSSEHVTALNSAIQIWRRIS